MSQTIGDDAGRLLRMRRRATALLLFAAVAFVWARWAGGRGWIGFAEAAAEAAMVGGLADWFAVTALFRHPLGLKIPHTAIIPTRKDALGVSLAEFVQTNFLDDRVVTDRLAELEPAARLGRWLDDEAHAHEAAGRLALALTTVVDLLDDDLVQDGTGRLVVERLRQVRIAPILGRLIGASIDDGRIDRVVDRTLATASQFLADNRPVFRGKLGQESPWWVPEWVDDRVYKRIEQGLTRFADDVRNDPDHTFRVQLSRALIGLQGELVAETGRSERVEALWQELLGLPDVHAWAASLWAIARDDVLATLDDPSSALRHRVAAWLRQGGRRLGSDDDVRIMLDRWLAHAVDRMLGSVRVELGTIIATTVQRWDADDASNRIELAVGRDLQFIRINGTLVGALVGVVIHTATVLIG